MAKNFRFFISNTFGFLFRKKVYSLKITVPEFSNFIKSTYLLLAVFLKFIFNKKEKCGFICPKTFDFLFQKHSNIYFEKEFVPWKYMFQNIKNIIVNSLKNQHKHELFHRYFQGFCLLFRNTYLKEHLWVAASVLERLHKGVHIS